jgi:hypothetical protein
MRRPPPPHGRGAPKTPGSGRRRGSLNRRTIELRALMTALAGDVDYQQRLRQAFIRRRLHPSTEIKMWEYAVGKPKDEIEMSAKLSIDAQIETERRLFATLTIEQMSALAAESQALVDRMMAMAKANAPMQHHTTSPGALLEGETTDVPPPSDSASTSHRQPAEHSGESVDDREEPTLLLDAIGQRLDDHGAFHRDE